MSSATVIAPAELLERLVAGEPTTLLDVREDAAWRIEAASAQIIHVAPAQLPARAPALARELPPGAVVVCNRGVTAQGAAEELRARGARVRVLDGGMRAWIGVLRAFEVDLGVTGLDVLQIQRPGRGCLSYLLVAGRDALVVDPAPDAGFYVDLAREAGAEIREVVDTHLHADHLSGAPALVAGTKATLRLPDATLARRRDWPEGVRPLRDGEPLSVGDVTLRVLTLPGHTTDMTGLRIASARSSPAIPCSPRAWLAPTSSAPTPTARARWPAACTRRSTSGSSPSHPTRSCSPATTTRSSARAPSRPRSRRSARRCPSWRSRIPTASQTRCWPTCRRDRPTTRPSSPSTRATAVPTPPWRAAATRAPRGDAKIHGGQLSNEEAHLRYQFIDVRFDLQDEEAGRRAFLEGHVPGAVFLDLDRGLSAMDQAPEAGRHPLPSPKVFAEVASGAGIGPGVFVVAYDDAENRGAARLWWLLRHFGHDDVAVLSGGIDAWHGPLEAGAGAAAERAPFVSRVRANDTIGAEEFAGRLGEPGLLVRDARAPDRYRGETVGRDPVAGHIPGAVNMHYAQAASPEGALEADEIVVYCGSGVTACVDLLALERAGRGDARLYPGSWSQWCLLDLPVERGDPRAEVQ